MSNIMNGINQYKIINANLYGLGVSPNMLVSIKVVSVNGDISENAVETGMQNLAKVFNASNSNNDPLKKLNFVRVR